jgi:hydroxypyruvate reductase
MLPEARALLRTMFDAAVEAVSAERALPPHLPPTPNGRTVVIGAGKAAAAMAVAVERHWTGPLSGLVVTRYGHGAPTRSIEVIEAGHPVPDSASVEAAQRIICTVSGLTADDLVLCLMSGGASSLLALPVPGVTLQYKQQLNAALLRSGATIHEMNTVRKHLSVIKGGRLAALAAPAKVVTLVVSDVVGDDPAMIGSGPTVADATTAADALTILRKYAIPAPDFVIEHLTAGRHPTIKPNDARVANAQTTVIATAQQSLARAAEVAHAAGFTPLILGDDIEGEAREVAREQAALVRQLLETHKPVAPPCVVLSGGETTVTVRGNGRGGRNAEFLLALTLELDGRRGVYALAADTDGIDGSEDNAGAYTAPDSLQRATQCGLDAAALLQANDAYGFFAQLDDLLMTGPTRTNVNDFRAILIGTDASW